MNEDLKNLSTNVSLIIDKLTCLTPLENDLLQKSELLAKMYNEIYSQVKKLDTIGSNFNHAYSRFLLEFNSRIDSAVEKAIQKYLYNKEIHLTLKDNEND